MAGKTTDTEALRAVKAALRTYREAVMNDVRKMRDAAKDCRDNLGGDEYSKKTIADLAEALNEILAAVQKASELEEAVSKRIIVLEEGEI